MTRTRTAAVLAAVAVAALTGAQSAVPGGSDAPRQLLPDLRPVAPFDAKVVQSRADGRTRYLLAFPSITENVGDGALNVLASRRSRRDPTMSAVQVIDRSDGSVRRTRKVGILRYNSERGHAHWHYLRFMIYELRGVEDDELIAPDQKSGFCLGDRHAIDDREIEGAADRPRYTGDCGVGKRRLLKIREGISVGWYDDYAALLEGQYVDITGVEDGRYVLVHHVNRNRNLRETRYANNSSSSLIELKTPAGSTRPKVEIIERCGDRRRCTGS